MVNELSRLSGWTYLGMVEVVHLSPEFSELKQGEHRTVEKDTQYLLYLNKGWMVGQRRVLNMYRRFKPKEGNKY
jgi:hypothetical protein